LYLHLLTVKIAFFSPNEFQAMMRYLFLLTLLVFFGCGTDRHTFEEQTTVVIRLPSEPDMLNPARSSSSYATQIEAQIFLPLAEFDPFEYDLEPILIERIPIQQPITQGPDSGGVRFHYNIRPEAQWEDGTPVSAQDYAFTVKMALNPLVDVAQWRGFLTFITDVSLDPEDPRAFDVTVGEQYMLADLITCNFNIYPKHIYDTEGFLDDVSVRDLSDPKSADALAKANPKLKQFADAFMQSKFANEIIVGNGPYRLVSWETGQRIILERVKDWWGDQIKEDLTLLRAYPARLIYEIVPDENTALTMLKSGSIDVMSEISSSSFIELRADSNYADQLQFFTPKLQVYNYLELNNRNPVLSDKQARKALAHVVDCNSMVENIALGMASRTTGPFHPDVDYYNKDIVPVSFDLDKARALLAESGWTDSNNNGTVDKVIGGKKTEFQLDIVVSQRGEGQAVAVLVKENAAKAGIGINIVTRDGAGLQQDVRSRNFDIAPLRRSGPITAYDPYEAWHSNSDAPGGANRSGFRNAVADSLIMAIRSTTDPTQRYDAYRTLQVVIAEEQPVIFLYIPLERIIASRRFTIQSSTRKPGYFEQLFKLSSQQEDAPLNG
jgi:peptide/nickel transport system substrate-binding protein